MTIHHCGDPTCPFEGAPIISEYTDASALDDGVLVDVTSFNLCFLPAFTKDGVGKIHVLGFCPLEAQDGPITKRCRPITRMTRTLWTAFEQGYSALTPERPLRELATSSDDEVIATVRTMDLTRLVEDLHHRLLHTRDSEGDGYLMVAPGRGGTPVEEITWLIDNGEGGFTLMLPGDY